MRDACKDFREARLHGEEFAPRHPEACPSCGLWIAALERMRAALTSLPRRAAPAELEQAMERELAGDRTARSIRALQSLVRRGAPALLDERVADWIGPLTREQEAPPRAPRAEALRALEVKRAPHVLERLVREELQHPQRHRVERFSGTLARLGAPQALAERLRASVRRRALVRLVAGPLAALAAAGLIVWFTLRGQAGESHGYRFQVLHPSSLAELDPTARVLAETLGGGVRR